MQRTFKFIVSYFYTNGGGDGGRRSRIKRNCKGGIKEILFSFLYCYIMLDIFTAYCELVAM
jgi:hypothetical protein